MGRTESCDTAVLEVLEVGLHQDSALSTFLFVTVIPSESKNGGSSVRQSSSYNCRVREESTGESVGIAREPPETGLKGKCKERNREDSYIG